MTSVVGVRLQEQCYRPNLDQRSDNPMPLGLVRLAGTVNWQDVLLSQCGSQGRGVLKQNELAQRRARGWILFSGYHPDRSTPSARVMRMRILAAGVIPHMYHVRLYVAT